MSFPRYAKYKDSGVEWMGEVPEHWEVRRLGSCFAERREKISDKDYQALSVTKRGILPQLDNAAKTDDSDNRKRVCKGDFVINSRSDRNGSAGVSELDGSVSLINIVLRPLESVHHAFVHNLLRSQGFQQEFYRFGKGIVADLWTTNFSEMRNILIAVPPLREQATIGSFLNNELIKIDTLIADQQILIEVLEEKLQAVISHAVTKGLNPDAPTKPSGIEWIGDVPAHWDVTGLTKYLSSVVDYRGRTPTKVGEGVFLLTARNIRGGRIDYSASEEFIEPTEFEAVMNRGRPEVGDVVFTTEAPLGQVANIDRTDVAIAQRVIKFRGAIGILDNYFLKYWIMGTSCQANLMHLATGSTALGIKGSKVGQVRLCIPPINEQHAIALYLDEKIKRLNALVSEADAAIVFLEERRAALISAAVTGKIDARTYVSGEAA